MKSITEKIDYILDRHMDESIESLKKQIDNLEYKHDGLLRDQAEEDDPVKKRAIGQQRNSIMSQVKKLKVQLSQMKKSEK